MGQLSKPSLREFFRVVWEDWGSRVSGALSVPFTVLAFFVNANYAKALWGCLAVLAILATLYQVWAKERRGAVDLAEKLEREREQNRPKFALAIEQIIVGETDMVERDVAFKGSVGILNITVINNGAPSIADKWQVTLVCAGVEHKADLYSTTAQIVLPSGELFQITPKDAIYDRAITPIARGGLTRGWAMAAAGGVSRNLASAPGTRWTVSCEDSLGVRYSAFYEFTERNTMQRPQYYPGSFQA